MSWNEAWATWNAIQTSKTRELDYLKALNTNNLRREKETIASTTLPPSAGFSVNAALQSLVRLVSAFFSPAPSPLTGGNQTGQPQKPMSLSENLTERLNNMAKIASQRLATLLHDLQSIVTEGLRNNLEVIKSLIAQLKWESLADNALSFAKRLFSPERTKELLSNLKERFSELLITVNRFFESTEPPKTKDR